MSSAKALQAYARSAGMTTRDVRITGNDKTGFILRFSSGEVEEAGSFERARYIIDQYAPYMRHNPGARKLTKKQRRAKAARTAKKRGLAKAVTSLMKRLNPSLVRTSIGFRPKRLKGGGISIIPVKRPRRSR